ncbi:MULTISPECIES: endonuclease [unclassified Carboxylicivirga]|uniref:endonuclease n=1 Tax=Carboxylicivirga TaxID=1628153 RepID=UPI003D34E9A6
MKNSIRQLLLVMLVAGIYACDKDGLKDAARIHPVSVDLNLKGAEAAALANHSMEIRTTGGEVVRSYTDLQNLPAQMELPEGTYQAEVFTSLTMPAFDQPLYGGQSDFSVVDQQTTNLNLSISQTNFSVAVAYATDFTSAYTNYSTAISNAHGTLEYPTTETRFGYFTEGPITVTLTYTDGDNVEQTVEKVLAADDPAIAAGTALTIRFKASEGDVYTGYYATATGKTGLALKTELGNIISANYTERSYGDLWEIYKQSDIRSDGTIWDMYSDNPTGPESYTYTPGVDQCGNYSGEGSCYNREHSVPKSWFNDASPMYTDMVHLVPTDGYVNNKRGNHPFGEVGSASWTSSNGCMVGSASTGLGYTGTVFEPIDEYKGDFARIYFYFVTRYDDRIANWDNAVFSTDGYGLDPWAIDMFLQWSANDPVSEKERNRNEFIQQFQNNRNPYVDHPEFIDRIWGSTTSAQSLKNTIQTSEINWSVN